MTHINAYSDHDHSIKYRLVLSYLRKN